MNPTAITIALGIGLAYYAGVGVVHGVKKVDHAVVKTVKVVDHAVVKYIKHPWKKGK